MLPVCLIQILSLIHLPVVKRFIIAAILYMISVFVDIVSSYLNDFIDINNHFGCLYLKSPRFCIRSNLAPANNLLLVLPVGWFGFTNSRSSFTNDVQSLCI